jgi:CRP-like cAMP-binding protein
MIETGSDTLLEPPVGPPATQSNREGAPQVARRASIENSLLAAIPQKEYRHLLAWLEPVTLTFGEILYEPGETIRHVYFPCDSLVSLLTLADGHLALEVGLLGREGMVGFPLVLGHSTSSVRALVQGSGTAMRMAAAHFRKEFRLSPPLQRELYRYIHTLMAQISQTAACNRFHVVETRLARWLLMTHDRVKSDQFRMTQEFLGHMLGVRRVGVTKAAQALQERKLISYSRGNIIVLDRSGLEAAACECYKVVKDMHDGVQAGHVMRRMQLSTAA